MDIRTRILFSVLMFLQFFVWGTWYVTMGTYLGNLGFDGSEIGAAYSTTALAAIFSPLFIGMIADKFFDAQKVLGFLHIIGGVFLYMVSTMTTASSFFWVLLLHTLCYMPTIALSNAVAFHHIDRPEQNYPQIRVLGTIGWIAAGFVVGFMQIEDVALQFQIGAAVSILLGIYSFFLPKTPPKAKGKKSTISELLGLDAIKLMKDRSFAILIISSFLISIPLSFYFGFANAFLNETGMEYTAAVMTLGQWSEIIFMLLMPFFFRRLGVKKMILIGMLAWAVRYVLFAYGDNDSLLFMFYLAIILHGICYDFFFVTGQIYVDNKAPAEMRANAQGFITLITYGIGMYVGTILSGEVVEYYEIYGDTGEITGHHWGQIWIIPAVLAVISSLFFLFLFKDDKESDKYMV